MRDLKQTAFTDRLATQAEAKKALLARFKPRAAVPDPEFDKLAEKRAAERAAIKAQREAEKAEALRLKAEKEAAEAEARLMSSEFIEEQRRAERRERKAAVKEEQRQRRAEKKAQRR